MNLPRKLKKRLFGTQNNRTELQNIRHTQELRERKFWKTDILNPKNAQALQNFADLTAKNTLNILKVT